MLMNAANRLILRNFAFPHKLDIIIINIKINYDILVVCLYPISSPTVACRWENFRENVENSHACPGMPACPPHQSVCLNKIIFPALYEMDASHHTVKQPRWLWIIITGYSLLHTSHDADGVRVCVCVRLVTNGDRGIIEQTHTKCIE